jgi:carbon storage regulator
MLVLSRKLGERIVVPECRLTITVSAIRGNTVRLAISAPPELEVYREEVRERHYLEMPETRSDTATGALSGSGASGSGDSR